MSGTDEIRMTLTIALMILVALKLTGVLAWPWLWVLAPFWVPALVAVVVKHVAIRALAE